MNREAEYTEIIEDASYDISIHEAEWEISKQAVKEWKKINDDFRYGKESKRCAKLAHSLENEKNYVKSLRIKLKEEREKK